MTLDLPRALDPWKPVLSIFEGDVAASLGDVVARLSVLVGPLERESVSVRGEPDGVAGIARRGPLDRLLASEWALLAEVPDEFLRRAVEQQLAFHEVARREPSVDRRSIALFDAGATQLGGPRVVHVAALVLLAQRARDAGARFAWGILQDPSTTLHDAVTAASVLGLLRARSRSPATEEDAARWAIALGAAAASRERPDEGELWLVGGAATHDPARGLAHARIVVEDSLDPARPASVLVVVHAPRRPQRAAQLDLPPAEAAVRLLRNPFAVPTFRRVPVAAFGPSATPFVFSWNRRKLFTRATAGALLTLPITGEGGMPRVFAPSTGEVLLGAGQGQRKQRTFVLVRSQNGLVLHWLDRRDRGVAWSANVVPGGPELAVDGDERSPLLPLFPGSHEDTFVLARGRLIRLHHGAPRENDARRTAVAAPAVAAFAGNPRAGSAGVRVVCAGEAPEVRDLSIAPRGDVGTLTIELVRPAVGVVDAARVVGDRARIALPTDHAAFVVHELDGTRPAPIHATIVPRAGDDVIGVHAAGAERWLVVIRQDRRGVELVGERGVTRPLFEVGGEIVHAQVSPQAPVVVALLRGGGLEVRRIAEPAHPLVRFEIGAAE